LGWGTGNVRSDRLGRIGEITEFAV